MQLLPDDHKWQTFSGPFTAEEFLQHTSSRTAAGLRRKALRQLIHSADPYERLEALQMIYITSEAIGLRRYAEVPAILDAQARADEEDSKRRNAEYYTQLIKDFSR